MDRDEVSSLTKKTDEPILTGLVEAVESRDLEMCSIQNSFVQTQMEGNDSDVHRTIIKIRNLLLVILIEMDSEYEKLLVTQNKPAVLCVHLLKALYGMLVSAMLFYKKFHRDLIGYGFKVNSCSLCVANMIVRGRQMTVSWQKDDYNVIHVDPKAVPDMDKRYMDI